MNEVVNTSRSKISSLYRLYIFDFDYTLFDTSAGTIHCTKAAFAGAGVSSVTDDEIRRGVGLPLKEFFGHYVDDLLTIGQMEQLFLKAAAEAMVELSVPYPNTISAVNELTARGAKLAICTGKYRDRVYRLLAKYSIAKNFDVMVCGDEMVRQKPDPEGLISCMASFGGIGKSDVVYVGDHPYDIIAAQRCGIDSVAISSGSTTRLELASYQPTYLIDDLGQLLSYR